MPETGFILAAWARPHWNRNMCHTIEKCTSGRFMVMCWDLQEGVFVADTRQECVQFLGHDDTEVRQADPAYIPLTTVEDVLELMGQGLSAEHGMTLLLMG